MNTTKPTSTVGLANATSCFLQGMSVSLDGITTETTRKEDLRTESGWAHASAGPKRFFRRS